jgi:hypothetical protein
MLCLHNFQQDIIGTCCFYHGNMECHEAENTKKKKTEKVTKKRLSVLFALICAEEKKLMLEKESSRNEDFSDGFFEKQIRKKLMCFVLAQFKYYLYTSLVTI